MVRQLACTFLVALHAIVACCATSFAETPLVVAELEAERPIAQADLAYASAEQELAVWKLAQLKSLQSDGHASWLEVAQQQVAAMSATAHAKAAKQYVQVLIECQARLAKLNVSSATAESECIRLYMPGSPRLVAWMSSDVASLELSKRHLENLRREFHSALDIDLGTLETAVEAAERAVGIYGRRESDAHLLRRAEIRLQLANAEYKGAKARKAAASIVARRMALIQSSLDAIQTEVQIDEGVVSPALARAGTRFVDASSDSDLTELVRAMAVDESTASEQIGWLKQQRDAALARIDALQKLAEHARTDRGELDQAKQKHSNLERQIEQTQQLSRLQQRIADSYQQAFESQSTTLTEQPESMELDDASIADANIVRHWLELQHFKLQAVARRAEIEAQHDYLLAQTKRVERIPVEARPPKELDHMRYKVMEAEQQRKTAGRELTALRSEQQRFCRQLQSQQGNQYQLVQADKGKFIGREQFEIAEALIATVGFVGQSRLFPELPNTYPYIESTILIDCLTECRIEQPSFNAGLLSRPGWGCGDTVSRRVAGSSIWDTRDAFSGLRSATDWNSYPNDLFCYAPYGMRRLDGRDCSTPRCDWPSLDRDRLRTSRPYGSCPTYAGSPVGYGYGLHSFGADAYRIGCPTRSSFPYRSSYLYRSAFPTRSNLYGNRYGNTSRPYSGLGYTTWLNATCFD